MLSSRIETTPMLDDDPPCFRVSWLYWDSRLRHAGLKIGDLIVAVNGRPIVRPETLAERQHITQTTIGQYDEARGWAELKLTEGSRVTLAVRRRAAAVGWDSLTVQFDLHEPEIAQRADGSRIFGPGGPAEMQSDDLGDSWTTWDEKVVRDYGMILDGGWQRQSLITRPELQMHLEKKPRVDYLVKHYPGPYSAAMAADWQAVHDSLNGAAVTLPPGALDYRRAEEDRVAQVRAAAATAWQAAQSAVAATTITAFPAVHPIRGDRAGVVGKYVVLPPLANADWISEAGHGWFAAGNESDNWYFIDAEGPPAIAMLRARERFERLVSPNLAPSFSFIGRIAEAPKLLVVGERAQFGLQLDLTAALIGEAMFVALLPPFAEAAFAGEEAFHQPPGALPPADASPSEVMAAFVLALKNNDQGLWNELFADWYVDRLPDGRPLLQPFLERDTGDEWERSRASMLGRVFDVRVGWTGEVRMLMDGKAYPGAPVIEEVDQEIDHIGSFEDGYHVFNDVTVHRQWQLQRVNRGPWRIHSVQSI